MPQASPHPDALIPSALASPPVGKKKRSAKAWSVSEIADADAVINAWNRCFDRCEGGWRAHKNYANRHLVILLLRDQANAPEPDRFTVAEIERAIRAYRDDPGNKRLDDGAGRWTRFANWFRRDAIAENIDHQLLRIGYNRQRGLAGNPNVPKSIPLTPEQDRARRLVNATPWPFTAESAANAGLSLRAYLQRELDKGNTWTDRAMRDAFEITLARYRRQLAALDNFEALGPAHVAKFETRARKGFELISNRPPRPDSATDAIRVQAIALALFEKEKS